MIVFCRYDGRSTLFALPGAVRGPDASQPQEKLNVEETVDLGGQGKGRRSKPWRVTVKATNTIDMRCMTNMKQFCDEVWQH